MNLINQLPIDEHESLSVLSIRNDAAADNCIPTLLCPPVRVCVG